MSLIDYMRISVTDRCNFRCFYCMPKEGVSCFPKKEILKSSEIERISRDMASLGIRKLKITGGEPLLREDLVRLVESLNHITGIEEVTLTTNGSLLAPMAENLKQAGLTCVNVSLDTLKEDRFKEITGQDSLESVLEGIKKAINCGLKVKLNCVVLENRNVEEVLDFTRFARENNIPVRFIEAMPIGEGKKISMVDNDKILEIIKQQYKDLKPLLKPLGNGPAIYYGFSDKKGAVGLISGVSHKFCQNCNRIRLTCDGFLKLCLASEAGINLKERLRSGISEEAFLLEIEKALKEKPLSHHFEDYVEEKKTMNQIGG